MNCVQARRALLVDPSRLSDEVRTHVHACERCAPLLREVLRQQSQIAAAVAETSAAGILPPTDAIGDALRPSRRRLLAAAASVAVVITGGLIGAGLWRQRQAAFTASQWAEVVMQHFREDPTHLLPPDPHAAPHTEVLLGQLGARRLAALPPVIQGGVCRLQDCQAAHLVLDWQGQRVVAFLLPRRGRDVVPLAVDDWHGELRPMVGGMVATLARRPEAARSAADALASAVAWMS